MSENAAFRIDINKIKEYLPHRYPFLLVDRVIACDPGKSIIAIKNVTANEPFFNGHFPQKPVMPGFLQLEALAQTAGILYSVTTNTYPDEKNNWFFLAGVNKARFKRVVTPGDQLQLHVSIARSKMDIWVFDTKTMVDNQIACSAELMIIKGELL